MFKSIKKIYFYLFSILITFSMKGYSESCTGIFNHDMRQLHSSNIINLCELTKNKPTLVVNTASYCGFTGQFKSLESIHKKYSSQGLVVLGFASDDFNQEDKDEENTAEICYKNYGVTFTMLAPSHVKGKTPNPIFNELIKQSKAPRWNFNKYLIDKRGVVTNHFGSMTSPESKKFQKAIEKVL